MAQAATQSGGPARMIARRRLGRMGGPGAMRLNITAMLDVMLQLLIFLLLTAGWTLEEGKLPAKLPAPGAAAEAGQPVRVRVRVAAVGEEGYRLEVGGQARQPEDFGELAAMLSALRSGPRLLAGRGEAPELAVVVEAEGPVRWQHVVNALNAAVKAGYSDVSFGENVEPGHDVTGTGNP